MEVLDLVLNECGVRVPGIYVVDEDAGRALAGPFEGTADAIAWIEHRSHAPVPEPPPQPCNQSLPIIPSSSWWRRGG